MVLAPRNSKLTLNASANLVQRVVEERAGRLSSSGGEVAGLQAIRLMWQVCVSVRVTSGSAVGTARFAE
jgi:hypothetical protein